MSVSPRTSAHLRRALVVAGVSGLLFAAAQLPAAAVPGETSADTTVANVGVNSAISLTGLTPDFTLNGLPGTTVTGPAAVSYTVTTNNAAGYTVTVQAADDVLSPAGTGNNDTIPIANLQVQADGAGAYTPLSDTNAIVLQNQGARSAETGDAYSDDYRVDIPFVASDVYSVTLNYIATTL